MLRRLFGLKHKAVAELPPNKNTEKPDGGRVIAQIGKLPVLFQIRKAEIINAEASKNKRVCEGSLPETDIVYLKIGAWKMNFLLGWPIFRGKLLVSGSVCFFSDRFWFGNI